MKERFTLLSTYLCCAIPTKVNTTLPFTFLFLFITQLALAQPANDDCLNAINVPTDGTCQTFNNTDATFDIGNGNCTGGTFNVW